MKSFEAKHYLLSVGLKEAAIESFENYPLSLPAIRSLNTALEFHPSVTFIVGENGSGKSTLLEALAVSQGFNPEGGTKKFQFFNKNLTL